MRCECGTEVEDLNRVLFKYRKYEEEREFILRKINRIARKLELDVDKDYQGQRVGNSLKSLVI